MKFGKRLQCQIDDTLPEWRDKYLSYKQLKKRLKVISAPDCFTAAAFSSPERDAALPIANPTPVSTSDRHDQHSSVNCDADSPVSASKSSSSGSVVDSRNRGSETVGLTADDADFIDLLNSELDKFNSFFMEKEEEYVIRLQELKEKCEQLKEKIRTGMPLDSNEMILIRKEIVNFHGEMVLLENYSSVNYTGLVKILKKHDKRTGTLLRMPYIRNVLQQPFFTTELLSKLVHECEKNLQFLFPPSSGVVDVPKNQPELPLAINDERRKETDDACIANKSDGKDQVADKGEDVDDIYKSTLSALRTIKELRQGSSTYNIFSLPPINQEENDVTSCAMIHVRPPN